MQDKNASLGYRNYASISFSWQKCTSPTRQIRFLLVRLLQPLLLPGTERGEGWREPGALRFTRRLLFGEACWGRATTAGHF